MAGERLAMLGLSGRVIGRSGVVVLGSFFRWGLIVASVTGLVWSEPAAANDDDDEETGSEPSYQINDPFPDRPMRPTTVPEFGQPKAIFYNPYGLTDWLRRHGIGLLFDTTNEYTGAVTPPTRGFPEYRQGSSNAGQYAVSLNMDWERIAHVKGFATHMVVTGRYGTPANRMFGDWLNHSSEIYGGGGNVVVHLVMAYGEETLYDGKLAIAAGRMAELSDFVASPLYCTFQNNAMCGRPRAAADTGYASTFPAGVWGTRVRGRPLHHAYIQFGLYLTEEGIFSYAMNRTGFKFNSAYINGVRMPLEMGWEPKIGGTLAGHYKIGAALTTAPQPDSFEDITGRPYALTGLPQRQHRASYNAWVLMDQKFVTYRHRPDNKDPGLTGLWGFLYNDKRVSLRNWQVFAGLISRGTFRGRPDDTLALAFSYTAMSPGVQRSQELLRAQGKALPNRATGIQRHAVVMELNYGVHLFRGVLFQPVAELFMRPNGQGNLRDAVLLGFKSHVEFL
ncbi:carbohydrate porin [Swaminathania salitolerans]|nr:carbohydrate porin [Swaminathania salitolerans]GBQ11183.1 carbohydrate-selective porin B [Swaminathania salitolerans LMG 21291]